MYNWVAQGPDYKSALRVVKMVLNTQCYQYLTMQKIKRNTKRIKIADFNMYIWLPSSIIMKNCQKKTDHSIAIYSIFSCNSSSIPTLVSERVTDWLTDWVSDWWLKIWAIDQGATILPCCSLWVMVTKVIIVLITIKDKMVLMVKMVIMVEMVITAEMVTIVIRTDRKARTDRSDI